MEVAKRIIDKADKFGVALKQLYIDPCAMTLATVPTAKAIGGAYSPQKTVGGGLLPPSLCICTSLLWGTDDYVLCLHSL